MHLRYKLLSVIGTLGIVILIGLLSRHIFWPRIVVKATAPDGTDMCIVQQFGEPFSTSFVYRKPGKRWGWFYYNHEDSYWGDGRCVIDAKKGTAMFYRKKQIVAEFDWSTETYRSGSEREFTGAQRYLPVGWAPSMSVYR